MTFTEWLLDPALRAIRQLRKDIAMNQTELRDALAAVGDQLQKATDEIVAAIAAAGQTTPDVDAAVERLRAAAKALDDMNPDAAPPAV